MTFKPAAIFKLACDSRETSSKVVVVARACKNASARIDAHHGCGRLRDMCWLRGKLSVHRLVKGSADARKSAPDSVRPFAYLAAQGTSFARCRFDAIMLLYQ